MSRKLANTLMEARSAASFFGARGGKLDWKTFAALKVESDRLAHNDLNAAGRLVDRIEQLAALSKDEVSEAFAQASRARLLHLLGKHRDADKLYESSARVLRSAKLFEQAAVTQKQQVDALTQLGRYKDALKTARAARQVFTRTDAVQLAQLENNVGNIYYRLDRYQKALDCYERAHAALESEGSAEMRALVDLCRSNIFLEMDRPEEAMRLLKKSASVWGRKKQKLMAAQARSKIAHLEFLRGNYNTALAIYYEAREQLGELGSHTLVAWCDFEIAEALLALNAFDDAMESAELARSRFSELAMPYESAQAAIVAALAAMGVGRFEQAQADLFEAREAFASSRNTTLVALIDAYLAELSIRRGDGTDATVRAESALRVFARQKLLTKSAYVRLLQARAAYLSNDFTRAARMSRLALKTIERRFAPNIAYQCHHLLGKLERARNRNRAALESFRRAVETVEQMRGGIGADEMKATFLRDKVEVYEDAISACLDQATGPMVEEAFRLVESSKSRALADLLARYLRSAGSSARRSHGSAQSETTARLLKLIENLNWYSTNASLEEERGNQRGSGATGRYNREAARCERQIAQLFRRIEASGAASDVTERRRATGAFDFCAALESNETAIEYFSAGDEISAFIVSRDEIKVARAVASKREVEQMLAALRFQLEKFNYGIKYADEHFEQLNCAMNYHLALMHRSVFARLEPFVKSEKLIIIPHGALHYVPFHALLNRRGYLVDQFEISYAPSATVLSMCRAAGERSRNSNRKSKFENVRGKLVALGVAQSDTPSIEGEIQSLAALFPDCVTLTGDHATRENLKRFAGDARFLHFASHGHFRRDNPMFSFLKLADSPLNFYSLLDLKLKAEMVTLSACHTGVNMVFPGDELHGLMRGFLYAGSPSLVASLWAANDVSTAELMTEMYSRIRAGAPKREALRAAQIAIKDAYGHPYYWAPFILMGNPN